MASILPRKTSKGELRYVAYIRRKGQPSRTRTFNRLTDAKAWARGIETAIQERRNLPHRTALKVTIDGAVKLYLDSEGFAKLSENEQLKRATQLWRWVWALGLIPVAGLTTPAIREASRKLKQEGGKGRPIGSSTLNRYKAALSKFCGWLIAEGLLEENPVRAARVERGPERERDMLLTADERKRLLVAADDPTLYSLIVLGLTTGGRQEELLGLRWSEVDLSAKRVSFLRTKNGEPRSLPLPEQAVAVLTELKKVRHLDGSVFGGAEWPEQSWRRVRRAARLDELPVDRVWKKGKAPKGATHGQLRFHDLRHAYASALAETGASLSELKAALGHKTLSQVLRYQHIAERHLEDRIRERLAGVELV